MQQTSDAAAPEASARTATATPIVFDRADAGSVEFFNRNGWVVLRKPLSRARMDDVEDAWRYMTENFAADIGVPVSRYLEVISQWRNLWKVDPRFELALRDIAPLAAAMLELPGARLFHDHIICKMHAGANGVVPWHQDSMYWPVDRTGLSTWFTPQDTPVERGCLEVVDGSHLWGASEPVDFMQDDARLPRAARTTRLPVKAGDLIVLHSRTWHRSAPTSKPGTRIAHIVLWLPRETRYWPPNADWHPTNAQVTVKQGEVLNDDEFPVFGAPGGGVGNTHENKNPTVTRTGGMFGATGRIQTQVQRLLNSREPLVDLLCDQANRNRIVEKMSERGASARADVTDVVERLWISAASFRKHRSRNVFCAPYTEWNQLHAAAFNNENRPN
ncbi:MAG: hypothetical protein GKR94_20345 [Gammaproteobacteria bacterium]|nr:hypothetical protein [Gammaproteobacteria bacterium]